MAKYGKFILEKFINKFSKEWSQATKLVMKGLRVKARRSLK